MKVKCSKCYSMMDSEDEYCPSCGACNKFYGMTDEEMRLLESQQDTPESTQQSSTPIPRVSHDEEEKTEHPWIKWLVSVIVLVVIGLILMSSNNDMASAVGEGMMEGVGEGVLKSLIVIVPCGIIALIVRVVTNKKKEKKIQEERSRMRAQRTIESLRASAAPAPARREEPVSVAPAVEPNKALLGARSIGEMTCPNCGGKVPEGSMFCNHCGAAVKQPDEPEKVSVPVAVQTTVLEAAPESHRVDLSKHEEERPAPVSNKSGGDSDDPEAYRRRLEQIRNAYAYQGNDTENKNPKPHRMSGGKIAGLVAIAATCVTIVVLVVIGQNTGRDDISHESTPSVTIANSGVLETADVLETVEESGYEKTGLKYEELSDGNYAVTGYDGKIGELRIPNTYNGAMVVQIKDNAFRDRKDITNLTIGGNITIIGKHAFSGCSNLKNIGFEEALNAYDHDVLKICDYAFSECVLLERVDMPNYPVDFGMCSFESCSLLSWISLENVERIGAGTFRHCSSLDLLSIKANEVESDAFSDCAKLRSVYYDCSSVPSGCFEECRSLVNFTGYNISCVRSKAFNKCLNLTNVDLGSDPDIDIASDAFDNCPFNPFEEQTGYGSMDDYAMTWLCQMSYNEITETFGMPQEYFAGMAYYYTDNCTYMVGFEQKGGTWSADGYDPYSYERISYIMVEGGSDRCVIGDTYLGGDVAYYNARLDFDAYDALKMGAGNHGLSWYEIGVRYTVGNGYGESYDVDYRFTDGDLICYGAKVTYLGQV